MIKVLEFSLVTHILHRIQLSLIHYFSIISTNNKKKKRESARGGD